MTDHIDKNKVEHYLNRICGSHAFANSPRNIRLLKFLVQKAVEGENVKEQVIGLELFKSKYKPGSNDGKVRVYMFNLRKKLQEYYENEGKNDAFVLQINKGQYNLSFLTNKQSNKPNWIYKNVVTLTVIFGVIMVNVFIFAFWNANRTQDIVWHDFFSSSNQSICLVSDHFVVSGKLWDGSTAVLRKTEINSEKELANYLMHNKSAQFKSTDFSFMTKMAPMAIHRLTKWFMSHGSDFSIRIESEFSYEDLRDNNLLFIGQNKTMTGSKGIFLRNSKVFRLKNNGFAYRDKGKEVLYQSKYWGNKRIDYTMVSFQPLDDERVALFFSSNNDIGVISTVHNFTDSEWLDHFYHQLPKDTKYFNALFKVSGMGRTELSCELQEIEVFTQID